MISENAQDILQNRVIEKLKERYPNIHPVMFLRSLEKARSPGDLFDILDTFPDTFPVQWDKTANRWKPVETLIPQKR